MVKLVDNETNNEEEIMAVDNQQLTNTANAQNEVISAKSPSKGDEEQKEARLNKVNSDAQSNEDEMQQQNTIT